MIVEIDVKLIGANENAEIGPVAFIVAAPPAVTLTRPPALTLTAPLLSILTVFVPFTLTVPADGILKVNYQLLRLIILRVV